MAKRHVDVEELRRIGVPKELVQEWVELENIDNKIVEYAAACLGKQLSTEKAWGHFSKCQACKNRWKQGLEKETAELKRK